MHNDNHFGNIMIKKLENPIDATYYIGKIQIIKKKYYNVCLYDFDLAYLQPINNNYLYTFDFVKNQQGSKDVWTLLNNLTQFYKTSKTQNIDVIHSIIHLITKGDTKLLEHLELVYSDTTTLHKNKYWNIYCENNDEKNCIYPTDDIYNKIEPLNVLNRFLDIKKFRSYFNISITNPYYQKYLKYKNKYVKLI